MFNLFNIIPDRIKQLFSHNPITDNNDGIDVAALERDLSELHRREYVITHTPIIIKPRMNIRITSKNRAVKSKKPVSNTKVLPDKLTKEELALIHSNAAHTKVKLTWLELYHLKRIALNHNIDDWISLIDTKLSYEENKTNIQSRHTAGDPGETELLEKYNRYADYVNDYYNRDII